MARGVWRMKVLSLFDGISAGRLALERAGIKIDKYYASEIDTYAIQTAKKNYPDTIHLGDVTKWREWDIETPDLIIGGSPCQGFSFAGKQLNFEDPRSKLFFIMVDILNNWKPEYFFLENVRMKQEYQNVISEHIGVKPVKINSSLISAQNRERLYWANWNISQPEDKGVLLKDVVFEDAKKPTVCMHNLYGGFKEKSHRTFIEKSPTIRTAAGGGHIPSLLLSEKALVYMDREVKGGRNHWDFQHHSDVRSPKSAAVVANFFKGVPYNVLKDWNCIRKFDPIECERLQTFPDHWTEGVSNTQRYKQLGNSWTVDIVAHIFKGMKDETP